MKKIIAIALVLMLCVSALSISAFAADTFTVTVEIDVATAPNAWAWGDYGDAFSSWPGVPMTKSGNVWKIDVPMGTTGFIVNNGSAKTADIAIPGTGDVTIKVSADFKTYEVVGQPAPTPPSGYYVTGDASWLGGWAACNEAGKMTEQNGIYVKEFTGVAAGDYKLKVNIGDWSQSWGGSGADGNYEFNVASANSKVTVKFNPADNTVTVEVNGDSVVTPPADPSFDAYYVTGEGELFGGWAADNADGLMTEGNNGIWTKEYADVPAGKYAIKVTCGNWDHSWGGTGDNGNYIFELTEASNVTVQFNENSQTVTVLVNGEPIAPTGDYSLAGVSVALLAATAGVVALVGMKKKED